MESSRWDPIGKPIEGRPMPHGKGGLSLTIMLLVVSAGTAHAQSNWTGAESPDWFTAGNWIGGVPAAGITANLNFTTPNPTAIDASPNATAQNVIVGANGDGELRIQRGGRLTNVLGAVGNLTGSQGAVTVSGVASTWTNTDVMVVGGAGSGSVAVQEGGRLNTSGGSIGQSLGSTGSVTISGSGSIWNNGPGGGLNVGSFGAGTLTITSGGLVTNNTGFSANIGSAANSQGTVTVTGSGSTWINR
jgi:T5SS/PEP-CTERM-associated repeat protein